MIEKLTFTRDGWSTGIVQDPEAQTFTRLRIAVGNSLVTRNVSKRGGGESEAITTSLLPLAEFLAQGWWALLYEPVRPRITDAFRARHRLDSGMRGYAFPAIALWSGGEEALFVDWAAFTNPFSQVSFLEARPDELAQLERGTVETDLMDLVETVLERTGRSAPRLAEAWDRVRTSIADPDEYAYCSTAGRLGLDPYDSDAPNIADWAEGIQDSLFQDISDIAIVEELRSTAAWAKESEVRLRLFPEINLSYFGNFADDELQFPAWHTGQISAELLRANTGVPTENPRAAVDELLGKVVVEGGELDTEGPSGLSAIIQRSEATAKIGTVAKSARQRRFRACAALYLAWTAAEGEDRAATEATTRRQQASRSFAAEMVAPRQALIARAPQSGFDEEDLLTLAGDFVCPYETIKWQALRAGIPLRGIELPRSYRASVMTAEARAVIS